MLGDSNVQPLLRMTVLGSRSPLSLERREHKVTGAVILPCSGERALPLSHRQADHSNFHTTTGAALGNTAISANDNTRWCLHYES